LLPERGIGSALNTQESSNELTNGCHKVREALISIRGVLDDIPADKQTQETNTHTLIP
jgi:hypothetical protein